MSPRILLAKPPGNLLLQILYFLVGGLVLIGAIVMGAVVLAIALGVAVLVGIVVWIRIWFLRRKLAGAAGRALGTEGAVRHGRGQRRVKVIEVEYEVVDERDPRDEREPRD